MTSPAVGIAYMLWLRLRWGAAATVIYLFALSVAAQFLPADPMIMALTLLTAAIAHLLHVFTLGPADFGVKSSGYPANMFVLPLRTRTLTGWPIVYGAATFAMLWVLVVTLVLKPIGFSPPVLWPAAIAAASAAWVQAIGWAPFPTPFARVPVLALAAIPLILLGTWAAIYLESQQRRRHRDRGQLDLGGTRAWLRCAWTGTCSMRRGVNLERRARKDPGSSCPSARVDLQPVSPVSVGQRCTTLARMPSQRCISAGHDGVYWPAAVGAQLPCRAQSGSPTARCCSARYPSRPPR